MFVWSYWKTIFTKPANPSKEVQDPIALPFCLHASDPLPWRNQLDDKSIVSTPFQFCLPKAEKERYEKEERPESQQEILWRAASTLPLYTRTGAGGKAASPGW